MRLYILLDEDFNVIYVCTQFMGNYVPVLTMSPDEAFTMANHLCEVAQLAVERKEQFEYEWDKKLKREVN